MVTTYSQDERDVFKSNKKLKTIRTPFYHRITLKLMITSICIKFYALCKQSINLKEWTPYGQILNTRVKDVPIDKE